MRAVVYFGSREIYKDFLTAVPSLLKHTQVDKVYAVIEDDTLPYDLPVECIKFPKQLFNETNTGTIWKEFGCARAAMTKLFPELDTILSLDLDTIVRADISELFKTDLTNYYFGAVRECRPPNGRYFNTGVCLMNLKYLRESGKDNELIDALNTRRFRYVSQDAMNELCAGKILELPSCYNASALTVPTDEIKIRHYAGTQDWRERSEIQSQL